MCILTNFSDCNKIHGYVIIILNKIKYNININCNDNNIKKLLNIYNIIIINIK